MDSEFQNSNGEDERTMRLRLEREGRLSAFEICVENLLTKPGVGAREALCSAAEKFSTIQTRLPPPGVLKETGPFSPSAIPREEFPFVPEKTIPPCVGGAPSEKSPPAAVRGDSDAITIPLPGDVQGVTLEEMQGKAPVGAVEELVWLKEHLIVTDVDFSMAPSAFCWAWLQQARSSGKCFSDAVLDILKFLAPSAKVREEEANLRLSAKSNVELEDRFLKAQDQFEEAV